MAWSTWCSENKGVIPEHLGVYAGSLQSLLGGINENNLEMDLVTSNRDNPVIDLLGFHLQGNSYTYAGGDMHKTMYCRIT